ncbi:tRNA (N6-isopentenyl adenosine(37)-C2)-methylthiotransferase MiaB [Patescibacteria group bacterium]|nr:tRNA (N6-isopentenyl adenosine(37)-C2)-methylthiotransferase MiaB [Patescibacteria group bacterium]MBU4512880.1 tRNA (N6-isopentenyl adenosine(37)-C2)-methylthiotransferase MiaB [Patescibacteria group bacterium]MCG2693158.1 tRNA (N6-isopentenyl adenosine(37)-C2)-methylthiotransferase MiaB [Candidatus Parcubacteria bacterium]
MLKKGPIKYYHLRIFGCQMNKSDGERIDAVMQKAGYKPTDDEKSADIIIAVMCSVRQSAVDRIYGLSGRWRKLPAEKVLTGCVLEFDQNKLAKQFDVILPITMINELPKLITKKQSGELSIINYQLSNKNKIPCNYLSIPPKRQSAHQAYVPIMTGCENFCTYCVVPYVRGREISRPAEKIINEVKYLVKQGYKKITLLGENVNNYKNNRTIGQLDNGIVDFPALLKILANIPGKFWLGFLTSNPENFSDELIEVIAGEPKICNYIHLPIQSGSNVILKKMNRKYTKNEYLKLIKKIKKQIPDIGLSTDIIVGFPGETKKQFEETAEVMRDLKYDMAYIARYSPRPGTAATRLTDDVTREEKKRREKVLTEILKETALENNRRLAGKILEVLVEDEVNKVNKVSAKGGPASGWNNLLMGKTETFKNVKFEGPKNLIGKFVKVKVAKANEWGIEGELINNK